MATTRIKDITTAASTFSSDDFVAIDGATSGTRKMAKADLISEVSSGVSGTYLEESNNLSDVASLDTSKLNMEIPDVGTAPNEVPLNGMLGDMAYQSSDGVSMAKAEIESTTGTATTQALTVTDGSSTKFVVQEDGKTGIGTTATPSSTLDIEVGGADGAEISLNQTGTNGRDFRIGSTGTGYGSAGNLIFYDATAGAERVRIDSSGRVGIGTVSPGGKLTIETGSGNGLQLYRTAANANFDAITFRNTTNTGTNAKVGFNVNELRLEGTTKIGFNTNGSERWVINSAGDLVSSGGAIDFGSGASTTLDRYEEGVHTATAFPNTSGSISLAASYDSLAYTKIGRSIIVTGWLQIGSVSSPVGTSIVFTLPTTTLNLSDFSGAIGGAVAYHDSSTGIWSAVSCATAESTNQLYVHIDPSTVAANDQFRISISYQSA